MEIDVLSLTLPHMVNLEQLRALGGAKVNVELKLRKWKCMMHLRDMRLYLKQLEA